MVAKTRNGELPVVYNESKGTYHLKVSKQTELAMLLQMVLDDKKFNHLGVIGYDGADFMLARTFAIYRGTKLVSYRDVPKDVKVALKRIRSYYNYSPFRQGRTTNKQTATLSHNYNESMNLYNVINSPLNKRIEHLKHHIK